MPSTCSPLRYPGGKSSFAPTLVDVIEANALFDGHYAEPYAGGGGLALAMLFRAYVRHIHINDIDPSIASFWRAVLNHHQDFIKLIEKTPVTITEWEHQKRIHLAQNTDDTLRLGFATFFLNRTNRSGIIKNAGPIGGRNQNGNYTLGCRYNKAALIAKIERLAYYKDRIHLHDLDALDFLDYVEADLPQQTIAYIDPPYFNKGAGLYTSYYEPHDHVAVADRVLALSKPWLATYDRVEEIQQLYASQQQYALYLNYSLQAKRKGEGILIASPGLRIPAPLALLSMSSNREGVPSQIN